MNRISRWIYSFLSFEKEAKRILAKHESSFHRIITIEDTYRRLSALNLKQDDLLRQSLRCVEMTVFRGAHVLAWAAMADYIEEWFELDAFQRLKATRPNWKNINAVEDLRERYPEFQIIEAFKACGFCAKSMENALKGLLAKRNECAHPSNYYPDLNTTLGYISDLLIRFEMLEKKKKSLFP